jgi:hypothetical protein
LRLVFKPLLVSKKQKYNDHRCTQQMIVKIRPYEAGPGSRFNKIFHSLLLSANRGAAALAKGLTLSVEE